MKQTPRRKPRAYIRYPTFPLYLVNVFLHLNSLPGFSFTFVSVFSPRTVVLWGPVKSTRRTTMPHTFNSTIAALNSWRLLPAREVHQTNHCKYCWFCAPYQGAIKRTKSMVLILVLILLKMFMSRQLLWTKLHCLKIRNRKHLKHLLYMFAKKKSTSVSRFYNCPSTCINFIFTACRLGLNPFQKNPKHASVLAERCA